MSTTATLDTPVAVPSLDDPIGANTPQPTPDDQEPNLEDEITRAYKELEDLLNDIEADPASVEISTIDNIERLLLTLPSTDARTRSIARTLYSRIHLLIASNEQFGSLLLSRFISYLSLNPSIGFMILTIIDTENLASRVGYNVVALRQTIIEFLEGVGNGAAVLENKVADVAATYIFDLINNNWGTDIAGYARVLTALQNPYFRNLTFDQVYDLNTQVQRLQATLQRLLNDGNTQLHDQLSELIDNLFPKASLELNGRQIEVISSINEVASGLENPALTPEEKRPLVIKLGTLLEVERKRDVLDEQLLDRVYKIVFSSFRRLVLLDSNSYSDNSYGLELLNMVLDLRKRSLEDAKSPEANLIPDSTIWEPLRNRFADTLRLLSHSRTDYEGVKGLYLIFIKDLDKCNLFGDDFVNRIFEGLYTSIPNPLAIELMCDLYEGMEDSDIDNIIDLMEIESSDQVRLKEAELMKSNMGRFILWLLSRSDESLIQFLSHSGSGRFEDIQDLIQAIKPEIREKKDELLYEKREKEDSSLKAKLEDIKIAIFLEIPANPIRREGISELEKKRSISDRLLQSVEPVFKSSRFRKAWLASVGPQLDAYTENKVLAAKKGAIESAIVSMTQLVGVGSTGYTRTLEMAIAIPEVKETFVEILRELKKIMEDPSHPLYTLMTPSKRAIQRILGSYRFNANVLELLPKDLVGVELAELRGYISNFEEDFSDYSNRAAEVEQIEAGTFSGIRKITRRVSIKEEAEQKLSESYELISGRRNIVMRDVIFIFQNPRLLAVYQKMPDFVDCIKTLIDSLSESGLKTKSEIDFIHFLLSGFNNEVILIEKILPETIKLKLATVLIRQFMAGDQNFRDLLMRRVANPAPPPRFIRSQFSNYLSAVYIFLQENDEDARNGIQALLQEDPVEEQTKGFFRRKKIPNPRNQFLNDVQELDDFFNGTQATFNPEVISYLSKIRSQNSAEARRMDATQQASTDLATVSQELGNINIVTNFEESRPFITNQADAIPQIDNAINVVNGIVSRKLILDNINFIPDSESEDVIKLVKMLLNLYYLNLFFKKDAGVDDSKKIMTLISNLIATLRLGSNYRLAGELFDLVDDYRGKYSPIVDASAPQVAAQRKTHMSDLVTNNTRAEILERGNQLQNLVNEFNQISGDYLASESRLINILSSLKELLSDMSAADIKILLDNLTEDQYKNVLTNMYIISIKFSRWPVAQVLIKDVFNNMITNIPDQLKPNVLVNLQQNIDQRVETYRKKHRDGRSRSRRYVGNKYNDATITNMNNAVAAAA